jgi:hypothetical protein
MNRRNARRPTRTEGGFTLVELTVSLLAGLVVAMGIVALSREATTTFHEEARSSAAEAALRTAADRLRADLERAGFMSTGNIQGLNIAGAPRIARPLGSMANVPTNAPAGLRTLMSLSLTPGGSVTQNGLALSGVQPLPLTPDILQISGNMTSADQFEIASYAIVQSGCTRIWLVPNSPAVYRVIGLPPYPAGGTQDADMHAVFFPMGVPGTTQFIVRVVDTSGCAQYLATCNATNGAGVDANGPYVDISANTPLVTPAMTGQACGVTGFGEGSVVNPVQTVQWEITAAQGAQDLEPAAYTNLGVAATDTTKYDLMRTFVDATGALVPNTNEIIAEYAVDLSFALSVDQGTALAPHIVTFPFDDNGDNDPYVVPSQITLNHGPERVRSVQARIVTRTALPDRAVSIALPTNSGANYGTQKFAYRYCMQASGCTSNPTRALIWARTRTIVTEAALPNQAGNFY